MQTDSLATMLLPQAPKSRRSKAFLESENRRLLREKHCLKNRLASLQKTNLRLRQALQDLAESKKYLKILTRYETVRSKARYWERTYGQKES